MSRFQLVAIMIISNKETFGFCEKPCSAAAFAVVSSQHRSSKNYLAVPWAERWRRGIKAVHLYASDEDADIDDEPAVLPPEKQVIKQRAEDFFKSLMADYEPIPDSNGMSVLRNVVDLETGERQDVVTLQRHSGRLALTDLIFQKNAIAFALLGRRALEKPPLLQSSFVCCF